MIIAIDKGTKYINGIIFRLPLIILYILVNMGLPKSLGSTIKVS